MKKLIIVTTIDADSQPQFKSRMVLKKRDQLNSHAASRYATMPTSKHNTKKINHFRLTTAIISERIAIHETFVGRLSFS